MHELIFKLKGFQPYGMYLTLVQFAFYTLLATFESFLKHGKLKQRK